MKTSHPSSPKSANLARIRDNQRRSRARRKEYVQELEAKYRETEAKGVQASAEMQAAARKVVEENRQIREENAKLKSLLHHCGVSDAEILHHLVSSPSSTSQQPPSPTYESSIAAPTDRLENMLMTKIDLQSGGVSKATIPKVSSPPKPSIQIAAPSPSRASPAPAVRPHPMRQHHRQGLSIIPHSGAAPALLSPTVASLPSSAVSTPSAFDISGDEYSMLSSPERIQSTPTIAAPDPQQTYMTPPLFGYQVALQPSSWPPRSNYSPVPHSATPPSLQAMGSMSPLPSMGNEGPNIPFAQINHTQAPPSGLHLSAVSPSQSKPLAPLAESLDYSAMTTRYPGPTSAPSSGQIGHMDHRWQSAAVCGRVRPDHSAAEELPFWVR